MSHSHTNPAHVSITSMPSLHSAHTIRPICNPIIMYDWPMTIFLSMPIPHPPAPYLPSTNLLIPKHTPIHLLPHPLRQRRHLALRLASRTQRILLVIILGYARTSSTEAVVVGMEVSRRTGLGGWIPSNLPRQPSSPLTQIHSPSHPILPMQHSLMQTPFQLLLLIPLLSRKLERVPRKHLAL